MNRWLWSVRGCYAHHVIDVAEWQRQTENMSPCAPISYYSYLYEPLCRRRTIFDHVLLCCMYILQSNLGVMYKTAGKLSGRASASTTPKDL